MAPSSPSAKEPFIGESAAPFDRVDGASVLVQLFVSVKREVKQKLRTPIGCCVEVLLPVAFVALLALLSTLSSDETKYGKLFVQPDPSPSPKSLSWILRDVACVHSDVPAPSSPPPTTNGSSVIDIVRFYYLPSCSAQLSAATPACGGKWLDKLSPQICYQPELVDALAGFIQQKNVTHLSSVDELVIAHHVFLQANGPPDQGMFVSVHSALKVHGKLFFTPDTAATRRLMDGLAERSDMRLFGSFLNGGTLPSEGEARAFLASVGHDDQTLALVTVNSFDTESVSVNIAMNQSAIPGTDYKSSRFSHGTSDEFKFYFASGFMSLERAILDVANEQSQAADGATDDAFTAAGNKLAFTPMPYADYVDKVFLVIAGFLTPLALVLAYLYGVAQVASRLVLEKELRLREAMAAMGVGKTTIYVSWLITFFLQNTLTSIIMAPMLTSTFMKGSTFSLIFIVVWLFTLSTTTLGSLIATFFSKSRTAAIATPILFFMLSTPNFALNDPTRTLAVSLMPLSPVAFTRAVQLLVEYEQNTGMGWNDIHNADDLVPMALCLFFLWFDTVLYAVLAWYLDNVLGSEWGVRQNPCFCFLNCCRRSLYGGDNPALNAELDETPYTTSGEAEAYPAGTPAVTIAQATKTFGSGSDLKKAVDNVSLKVFPGMVTAVLGHNGAGKTTLFNMLTGMLPMSGGDCFIYGSSITADMVQARRNIGLCPQHNILWNDMSCYEHLVYFARMKGVSGSDSHAAAMSMLTAVDLENKKDAKSASLSGGQKRKLSVGIAFIGGSRLVLLDEPTAGMDVHTRRATWDLIQKMSREEGRTIILTTHFMDEAELLGDRVGIMSAGQLHSYGSTTFLKSRLGEGYTLTVQYQNPPTEPTRAAVLRLVQDSVDTATEKESRGREQSMVLPMNRVEQYAGLLRRLEADATKREHGIVTVSMTVATIEDVFVSIAEESGGVAHAAVSPNAGVAASALSETPPGEPTAGKQFVGLMKKRFNNGKRDVRALVMQVLLPVLSILLALVLGKIGSSQQLDPLLISPSVLGDAEQLVVGGCTSAYQDALSGYFPTINSMGNSSYETAKFLQANANDHGEAGRTVAIQCLDPNLLTAGNATTLLMSNSTAFQAAAPYSIVAWFQGRLNERAMHFNKQTPTIAVSSFPLPLTASEQQKRSSFGLAFMAIFITVAFSFVPSTYTAFVVKERVTKAKLLQFVSGVGYFVYWASNFLFDLCSFLLTTVLAFILLGAFNRTEFIGSGDAFFTTLLLILLYGTACIPYAYILSLPFKNHSSAQNVVLGLFFIAGFGLTLAGWILQLLDGPPAFRFVFRLMPPACLGEGLIAIANAPGKRALGQSVQLLALDEAGYAVLYMVVETIVATLVMLLVDHPERTRRQQMLNYKSHQQAPPVEGGEPADVTQERKDAEAADGDNAFLRVIGLRKEFSSPNGGLLAKNVAVQNLTFHVPKGEIFGLLGTNGAGKTTTMNVITGECLPSTGHAWVDGQDVVEQAGEARKVIGYCPQFDALHDLMTVEEHLDLYIALRGIPDAQGSLKDALITAMGLGEYRRVKSMGLSGGNKRKLSVAISLVGAPRLLLLDEPTAGMDPVARRGLCDVVAAVSKHCAVVLTTHHLEEVEALADRAAIMVAGKMQCLGTLEHLKATLGSGYSVNVRVTDASKTEGVTHRLNRAFPQAVQLVEHHQTRLRYTVQGGTSTNISLASLFELLYNMKTEATVGVADYTVAQSSVEEVFLAVAGGLDGELQGPLVGSFSSAPAVAYGTTAAEWSK